MNKLIHIVSLSILVALGAACAAPVASATNLPKPVSATLAPTGTSTATLSISMSPTKTMDAGSSTLLPVARFTVTRVAYAITTWSDTVKGGQYTGCPLVTATITTNGAGTVNYYWLLVSMSDQHQESMDEDLLFESAGSQTVSWRFQVKDTPRAAAIYIASPNDTSLSVSEDLPPCISAP